MRVKKEDCGDKTLAEKLTLLFETRLSPDLDPFTLLEVAEGTNGSISPTYLMNLRDGKFSNPSMSKIKALSKFFGVPITYFYDEEGADKLRDDLRNDFYKSLNALSDEDVRRRIAETTTPRAQSIVINIVKNKGR
ncbi:MAG: helix-turn-helix transcriptional regulator [Actinomycetota bacterium]